MWVSLARGMISRRLWSRSLQCTMTVVSEAWARLGRRLEGKAGFSSDLDFDFDLEGWWDSGVHRRLALVVGARPRRREDGYGGGAASVIQWSAVTGKVAARANTMASWAWTMPNWFGPQDIWTWAWAWTWVLGPDEVSTLIYLFNSVFILPRLHVYGLISPM
ncbi:hypothetical protein ACLB2K_049949 [Fragaria x ananassa]